MAWTYTYDTNTPQGTDDPKEGDDRIRETKQALQERLAKDHYFPLTGTEVSDTSAGEHKKVTLRTQATAPTEVADKGMLYSKDVNSKAELHYKDEDGNEIQITSKGAIGIPGEMKMWGGATAPTGWILCDGSAVSRTTYAALFAAISTAFGVGDGSTTFNLPNLQSKFPIGKSGTYALGVTGGEATHILATTEMPSHTHGSSGAHRHLSASSVYFRETSVNIGNLGAINFVAVDSGHGTEIPDSGAHTHTSVGDGGAHNNLPPYQAVNYVIKT